MLRHHFTEPVALNQSLFESLKPGGRLAVIDFPPSFWVFWLGHPDGVPENRGGHGMPREVLIEELEQTGFVIEHDIADWWTWPQRRICVVARKPHAASALQEPQESGSQPKLLPRISTASR